MKLTKEVFGGLSGVVLSLGIIASSAYNLNKINRLYERSQKDNITHEELENIYYEWKERNEVEEFSFIIAPYLALLSGWGIYILITESILFNREEDYNIEI